MPRECLAVNRDSEDGIPAAGDPDDPAAVTLQGGCPRAKGTNGRFGGKVPSGKTAIRSPARSFSAASR